MSTDATSNTRTRFLLACAAAVVTFLVVWLGLARWQQGAIAGMFDNDRLQASGAAQRLVEEQRAVDIATRAELIAGNQAFVGYVGQALGGALPGVQVDTASIVDLLGERSGQLGLTLAAVLDEQGRLIAATQSFTQSRRFGEEPLFLKARESQATATGLWLDVDRLLQIAIRPLAADGSSEGFLVVGMLVNETLVDPIAKVGGTQVAILANTKAGRVVSASTLDASLHDALLAALPEAASTKSGPIPLTLGGERVSASVTPLFGSTVGEVVAITTTRRQADRVTAASLLRPLLLGGALALAALLAGAAWFWKRVLFPADDLAQLLERAADGDHRLTYQGRAGALERLGKAFNSLMASLGRA